MLTLQLTFSTLLPRLVCRHFQTDLDVRCPSNGLTASFGRFFVMRRSITRLLSSSTLVIHLKRPRLVVDHDEPGEGTHNPERDHRRWASRGMQPRSCCQPNDCRGQSQPVPLRG